MDAVAHMLVKESLTLNRYLYANADPETLIDPDGREGFDPFGAFSSFVGGVGDVGANVVAFGAGFAEGAWDFGVGTVSGTVALAGSAVDVGSCALNGACRDQALASVSQAAASVVADPLGSAGRAVGTVAGGVSSAVGSAIGDVGSAWSSGNFRRLGHLSFDAAATVVTVASVAGAVRALPAAARAVGRGAAGAGKLEGQPQAIADRAGAAIPGRGPVRGTKVHAEFQRGVDALGRRDVFTERSYLAGQPVRPGTKGSTRIDVGVGRPDRVKVVYDLKTGGAKLRPAQRAKIVANVPGKPKIKVIRAQ